MTSTPPPFDSNVTYHSAISLNSATLERELAWLDGLIDTRLKLYFESETMVESIEDMLLPDLTYDPSAYATFARRHSLGGVDRLALILALAPHVRPQLLDYFFLRNSTYDRPFTEFGGVRSGQHAGFMPTGETALFLLAGDDLPRRCRLQYYLMEESPLFSMGMMTLHTADGHEPSMSGLLTVSRETIALLTAGQQLRPSLGDGFPASLVRTNMEWDDLVIDFPVMEEILEMKSWIDNADRLMADPHLRKHIKPGYRALFYGPPGTGKTLTACLLGKSTGMDVYKVDLSMIVSKFIGETEKNLGRVFDMARNHRWILFFDEADALFGKRSTNASSANDRSANQEVAYLLQRIEDFPGVIILATNLKDNMDEAFLRRFQSMIYLAAPNASKRALIWKQVFGTSVPLSPQIDFDVLAEKYAISGGAIVNVLRYCVLAAVRRGRPVSLDDIRAGLRREFFKEGKTLEEVEKQTEQQRN